MLPPPTLIMSGALQLPCASLRRQVTAPLPTPRADSDRHLLDAGDHDHALGLVEKVARHRLLHAEHGGQHLAAGLESAHFLRVVVIRAPGRTPRPARTGRAGGSWSSTPPGHRHARQLVVEVHRRLACTSSSRPGGGSRSRSARRTAGSSTPISRQGAPPRMSAKGRTKPIEPPAPIIAVSLPKPALRRGRAASKAGPSGSVFHQGVPRVDRAPSPCAPYGAACGELPAPAARPASRASMFGTVRSESRARAASMIWLERALDRRAPRRRSRSATGRVQSFS